MLSAVFGDHMYSVVLNKEAEVVDKLDDKIVRIASKLDDRNGFQQVRKEAKAGLVITLVY